VSELRATMSDMPAKKCPFAIIMSNATPVCPPDDPWMTAVLYEAHLEHVDASEPLWRVPYFGQIVRSGTAEENFKARKNKHLSDAAREDKELGFHAVIDMFGADKIEWRVVSFKSGRRTAMAELADAEEKRLIAEHGGPLRDMDERLTQTLNLTEGGQWGDAAARWVGIDANRRRALNKFKAAMEAYVEEYESALVPTDFVNEYGYKLGSHLHGFRCGQMRKGMPEEADIVAWAEKLTGWAWDARTTDEYREKKSVASKVAWDATTDEEKAERIEKVKVTMATDASKAKRSKIGKDQWATASEEKKAGWIATTKAANATDESRAKRSKSITDMWSNQTSEEYTNRIDNVKVGLAAMDDETKAGQIRKHKDAKAKTKDHRSKVSADMRANRLRDELLQARKIALPFEPSQNKRRELREASTTVGPLGGKVLYMITKDGMTICRVTTQGILEMRRPVGPLVDPPPPDAFVSGSESD